MAIANTRRLSEETSEQIRDAVLRVATLGGLRAITMQAIADEAGCSKGTAGIVPIATHVAELIEQVFDPYFVLLAEFSCHGWKPARCLDRIDRFFSREPHTARLTVQICALGLVDPACQEVQSRAASSIAGYDDAQDNRASFLRRRRLTVLVTQAHMLEDKASHDLIARSERFVEHYLVSAFRHALINGALQPAEPN